MNAVNRMGRTPLHLACHENLVESHKTVITVGALGTMHQRLLLPCLCYSSFCTLSDATCRRS